MPLAGTLGADGGDVPSLEREGGQYRKAQPERSLKGQREITQLGQGRRATQRACGPRQPYSASSIRSSNAPAARPGTDVRSPLVRSTLTCEVVASSLFNY